MTSNIPAKAELSKYCDVSVCSHGEVLSGRPIPKIYCLAQLHVKIINELKVIH
jgi:hypothetical protein